MMLAGLHKVAGFRDLEVNLEQHINSIANCKFHKSLNIIFLDFLLYSKQRNSAFLFHYKEGLVQSSVLCIH